MDFLTFTVAGNVVVTDPITGDEMLFLKQQDNTFLHPVSKKSLTAKEICIAVMQRIGQARQLDEKMAAEKQNEKTASKKRFCMNCGEPIYPGDKFCTNCGKAIG